MRVLYITPEWPTERHFWAAPFIVRQVRFLREAGIEVEVFAFRGAKKLSNYVRIYRQLHRQLMDRPYDLAHCQFGHSGFLACLPKRLPLVVTFRGSDLQGLYTNSGSYHPISYPLRLAMQFVAYVADEVILVSRHMGRYLWRLDYHVIPGGLDLGLFRPTPQAEARRELALPSYESLVLFVGNPDSPVKRYHLAEAVVASLDRALGARLLVLTGIEPSRVPVYMNAADALLVTSRHEGSSNVIKEAMACNLPVVSVDVGDVRERVAQVEGCAVVSSDDPLHIAAALAAVLRRGKRTNGWRVAQELNEARLVQRVIGVYELAIRRHASQAE